MRLTPPDSRMLDASHYSDAQRAARKPRSGRVLIVSNRLPVTAREVDGDVQLTRSVGGLATGLRSTHAAAESWWIGWLGDLKMDAKHRHQVREQLDNMRASAVTLDAADAKTFYAKLSNGILWPLAHDRLDRLPLNLDGWDAYERVNERFADAVADRWQPGDLVWVHDYHLMRLPALLRKRIPEAKIGFFLHIPFPNPEIFFVLPARKWLVEGMLGADLIGFHTRRYRGHFTAALRRLLGLEMDADSHVRWNDRAVQLGVFPMGIDAESFNARAADPGVIVKALGHRPAGKERLILGIDRLDYSKGIPRRLAAIERLLEDHPEWRRNVRFLQVAVPSRGSVGAYRSFRREVEQLVSRINGRFGTSTWMPIHYMHQSLDNDDLIALYRAADVMLVTPVRDGMNLVAKEFVACRNDESGTLVLSEFAGAADDLRDALIVNPYDIGGVAASIHTALTMDSAERRRRMRLLRTHVFEYDVQWWTREFLGSLEK
ncbi:MAG TPA: bifunctional alpha,alpha-trehalose-phosphate synthase (UDP-forming)/trehalose-phosphatase [Gemmatimonadaceae bacterium]|nr:bifunctional alpha,alpha-trehalose-phosphate synthase (UDP-forming)/trehalose-phosphatase [Gemmatimonadaceae bacterium]